MKAKKNFKIGDKVFAKLKGHSTWPAQIVNISGKNYEVKFYGTGETASVKADGLFYYLQHKNRFKPLKRKTYVDAVEEIEKDIQEAGTDGNDNSNDQNANNEGKKGTKRKRVTSNDSLKGGKVAKMIEDSQESKESGNEEGTFTPDSEMSKSEQDHDVSIKDEVMKEADESLSKASSEADEILTPKEPVEEMKDDVTEHDEHMNHQEASTNDVAAIKEMTNALNLKKDIYDSLLIENEMHNQIIGVMKCLRSNKSDPKEALRLLHSIYEMEVDAFLLKKQPYLLDTVKKLKRYVGNTASWNLSEAELRNFREDTEKLRAFANKVFDKFKNVFPYKDDENFYEKFLEDVERFKNETKDLTESQLLALCPEPCKTMT